MRLGIIDIGSNSIKLLVAETGSPLAVNYQTTWETRISEGIGKEQPRLAEEPMERGVKAVQSLLEEARQFQPERYCLVATSAVRDAANRDEFVDKIRAATGLDLNILSGEQEAAYIAWGISTDPALAAYPEFCLADLGGGSLELIHIKDRKIIDKRSYPLGAVRLTEQCLADPAMPMRSAEMRRIAHTVRDAIRDSGFRFPSSTGILAGTGGGLNVARAVRAGWLGQTPAQAGNVISLTYLRYLFLEIAAMTLRERTCVPQLPEARADIMPTALVALITVAEMAGASSYIHSLHNLRYGIAASMLQGKPIETIAG